MDPTFDPPRRILSHALFSYLIPLRQGKRKELETHCAAMLKTLLSRPEVQVLIGEWQVVWGPAIFQARGSRVADNTMYVVKNVDEPQYVIAIAGTNPASVYSWVKQALRVRDMDEWPYRKVKGAKISRGTKNVMGILREKMESEGVNLCKFLTGLAKEALGPAIRIDVTGISLGGQLSSTLALALVDTQDDWDPHKRALVSAYSVSGPTAGNAEFAKHSKDTLGDRLHRYWNELDIAAYAWETDLLTKIPSLYKPHLKTSWLVSFVIKILRWRLAKNGYTQIGKDQPGLMGKYEPVLLDPDLGGLIGGEVTSKFQPRYSAFIKQAIYQHSVPYVWWLFVPPESESD